MVSVYACHFTNVHVRPNTRNNSRLMPTAKDAMRPSRYDVSIVTASADLETECRWGYTGIRERERERGLGRDRYGGNDGRYSSASEKFRANNVSRSRLLENRTNMFKHARAADGATLVQAANLLQQYPNPTASVVQLRFQVLFISCLVPSLSH